MIRATLKAVRFLKNNTPESLAIMQDYLNVSADAAAKIHDLSLRSLNMDGLVAKSNFDAEIRLAKEQLKVSEDISGFSTATPTERGMAVQKTCA